MNAIFHCLSCGRPVGIAEDRAKRIEAEKVEFACFWCARMYLGAWNLALAIAARRKS